ncbi:MAG: hypothetical protein JSS76_00705 [Bacteroidetes bacterium]|nr:hypothetical protein [Bacteroidota bacterium]
MKNLIGLFFLCFSLAGLSQKEDYVWLSGYHSGALYDSTIHHYFAIDKIDFNSSPPRVSLDTDITINFDASVVSFSDSNGNLLFYSNGIEIRNKWDEVIQNSRPMNDGWVDNVYNPSILSYGYPHAEAIMALPVPGSRSDFIFFQCFGDSTPGITSINCPKLLTTYLSMADSNGHGKVHYRDSLLLADIITPNITACKHANGNDWWILVSKQNSNCYYRILLTDSGAKVLPDQSCLGEIIPFDDGGICSFSPDGSKYAALNYMKGMMLYDFDRCTGLLSNTHFYPIPNLVDSGWIFTGATFSSNSRFLYGTIGMYLLQFDTWQSDPLSNPDTIARFDGFADPLGSYYTNGQLGPDEKIYITGNAEGNYSVIDSPNLKGAACQFRPHGLNMPALSWGPPNHPNYKLGKQIGGACDSTHIGIAEIDAGAGIRISPNPVLSTGVLTIYASGDGMVQFTDGIGRTVYMSDLHAGSNAIPCDALHTQEGMIFYSVQLRHGTANGKVVIMR